MILCPFCRIVDCPMGHILYTGLGTMPDFYSSLTERLDYKFEIYIGKDYINAASDYYINELLIYKYDILVCTLNFNSRIERFFNDVYKDIYRKIDKKLSDIFTDLAEVWLKDEEFLLVHNISFEVRE